MSIVLDSTTSTNTLFHLTYNSMETGGVWTIKIKQQFSCIHDINHMRKAQMVNKQNNVWKVLDQVILTMILLPYIII